MPNMEVALTCRARPSFRSSPHRPVRNRPAGAKQSSATNCDAQFHYAPASRGRTGDDAERKTTFQAGMCMKTKNPSPKSGVRSPKSKGLCGECADSDSWLLTPDSCSSRNEGSSGYIYENKRGDKLAVAAMSVFITLMVISPPAKCRGRAVLLGALRDHNGGTRKRRATPSPVVYQI